jgi:hypothetical protein
MGFGFEVNYGNAIGKYDYFVENNVAIASGWTYYCTRHVPFKHMDKLASADI